MAGNSHSKANRAATWTPQKEAFATGLACGLSQSEAYRRAYPHSAKWKDQTIWSRAYELARDGEVLARVQELIDKAAEANGITVERIIAELAKIAFGDPRRVMSWGPGGVKLLPSDALPDDAAAMVSEVAETVSASGGSLKLKTHDKLGALKMLAEIKGFVIKKRELTGKDGEPLIPDTPMGVLVVPGVMDEDAWEEMMAEKQKGGGN